MRFLKFGPLHKMTDHSTDCLYAVVAKIYNAVMEKNRRLLGQLPMGGEQEKLMGDHL